ncbi:ABC transporter sub-family G-like protein 1 [Dinothrombium tinctorium]|uniref:ABC transporter sub-family G-like protein 1 n=1 Tax=Dinothrombium tinctorium TaxID=1965070 RepID=A0A443QKX5_9ACAR|nr:ABC transporter sub-family G-like protein 1 [Dinothrombium tinctorium]RWS03850.1 ABC transporter sub-family G-like protein 1 [Dinothrombium tinctorium]
MNESHFRVTWEDLSYKVELSAINLLFQKHILQKTNVKKSKTILNGLNGEFKSGELIALMGPSGAGKSTLLECLSGKRRNGRSGLIGFMGSKKVDVAFIPQQDHFFQMLTVREALSFASKLKSLSNEDEMEIIVQEKNKNEDDAASILTSDHGNIVDSLLNQLSLKNCAETRISNLSGGQMKRLSIAQELASQPDILILDEPTSGLDSASCYQTVELLHTLTQQSSSIAIVVTIHQPSAKVFNLFHKIYVLSTIGKCIYDGPPMNVIDWLTQFNLICPQFYNPADYIIEVASGDYGEEAIYSMAEAIDESHKNGRRKTNEGEILLLESSIKAPKFNTIESIVYLIHRSSICIFRDFLTFCFRFCIYIVIGFFMGLLFYGLGKRGGCPPDLSNGMNPQDLERFQSLVRVEKEDTINYIGCIFFSAVFLQYAGICFNVVTFPLTINAITKEVRNGWYQGSNYFLALSIADLPLTMISSLLFALVVYIMSELPLEFDRFWHYFLILFFLSFISQSHGFFIGALFDRNVTAAVFLAPCTGVPFILFSGFLIKLEAVPTYLKIFNYLSYTQYIIEALIFTLYGGLRCGEGTGYLVEVTTSKIGVYLSSMFRIAMEATSDDYETDFEMVNVTKSIVNSITPEFLKNVKIKNGNVESAMITSFNLSEASYADFMIILTVYALITRFIAYKLLSLKIYADK